MQTEITTLEKLTKLIDNEDAILVYFYSNKCAPCISLRPKVEELISNDFSNMKLVFVNSEEYPKIPAFYSVFSNPTLGIFLEGKNTGEKAVYIYTSIK